MAVTVEAAPDSVQRPRLPLGAVGAGLVFKNFHEGVDLPVLEVVEYRRLVGPPGGTRVAVDLDPRPLTREQRPLFIIRDGVLCCWARVADLEVRTR